MSEIFRKKSLERVSSPEQLDDYIRVTTPSIWLVLLAVIILVAGILVWSLLGRAGAIDSGGTQEIVDSVSKIIN